MSRLRRRAARRRSATAGSAPRRGGARSGPCSRRPPSPSRSGSSSASTRSRARRCSSSRRAPADTGLLAAELLHPMADDGHHRRRRGDARGRAGARRRAAGITNVEFRSMDAEWIDLPTADVDGVLCRWGYMLLADPGRRAARDAPRAQAGRDRRARGVDRARGQPVVVGPQPGARPQGAAAEPPDPSAPGQFFWRDPARHRGGARRGGLRGRRDRPGRLHLRLPEPRRLVGRPARPLARSARGGHEASRPRSATTCATRSTRACAEHVAADGTVALPARTHVAAASA